MNFIDGQKTVTFELWLTGELSWATKAIKNEEEEEYSLLTRVTIHASRKVTLVLCLRAREGNSIFCTKDINKYINDRE